MNYIYLLANMFISSRQVKIIILFDERLTLLFIDYIIKEQRNYEKKRRDSKRT